MAWVELKIALGGENRLEIAGALIGGERRHELGAGRPRRVGMLALNLVEVPRRLGVIAREQFVHRQVVKLLNRALHIGWVGRAARRQ